MEGYDTIAPLGGGTYGKVYKVRRKSDGLIAVMKRVPLDTLSEREQEDALNETRLLAQVDHRHITRYLESFIEDGQLNIVMEYAEGGDLFQLVTRHKEAGKPLSEEVLWKYLIQISMGLKHLHGKRILHRDLKPQNIFLDGEDCVKIGDLGLGRSLGPESRFAYTAVGTPLYFSPEVCEEKRYNDKSDIWALGCLMYELATFRPPFLARNQIALAKKIVADEAPPLPSRYSNDLQFLVLKMMEKDPAARPGVKQILNYSPVRLRVEHVRLREHSRQLKLYYEQQLQAAAAAAAEKAKLADAALAHAKASEDSLREQLAVAEERHDAFVATAAARTGELEAALAAAQAKLGETERRVVELEAEQLVAMRTIVSLQQAALREPTALAAVAAGGAAGDGAAAGVTLVEPVVVVPAPPTAAAAAAERALSPPAVPRVSWTEGQLASSGRSSDDGELVPRQLRFSASSSVSDAPSDDSTSKVDVALARKPRVRRGGSASKRSPTDAAVVAATPCTMTADKLGLCSETSARGLPSFRALYAWRSTSAGGSSSDFAHSSRRWDGKRHIALAGDSDAMLLLFRVSNAAASRAVGVKSLRVRFADGGMWQPLPLPSAIKLKRMPLQRSRGVQFMIDVSATTTGHREVSDFQLAFSDDSAVEEVILLQYDRYFLELAAMPGKLREAVGTPAKRTPSKLAHRRTPSRRTPVRRTPGRRTPGRRTPGRTPGRRTPLRRTPGRKTPVRRGAGTPGKRGTPGRTPGRTPSRSRAGRGVRGSPSLGPALRVPTPTKDVPEVDDDAHDEEDDGIAVVEEDDNLPEAAGEERDAGDDRHDADGRQLAWLLDGDELEQLLDKVKSFEEGDGAGIAATAVV